MSSVHHQLEQGSNNNYNFLFWSNVSGKRATNLFNWIEKEPIPIESQKHSPYSFTQIVSSLYKEELLIIEFFEVVLFPDLSGKGRRKEDKEKERYRKMWKWIQQ